MEPTSSLPSLLPLMVHELKKQVLEELVTKMATQRTLDVVHTELDHFQHILTNPLAILAVWDDLAKHDAELRTEFADCFPSDIPHTDRLPTDVYHQFCLTSANHGKSGKPLYPAIDGIT